MEKAITFDNANSATLVNLWQWRCITRKLRHTQNHLLHYDTTSQRKQQKTLLERKVTTTTSPETIWQRGFLATPYEPSPHDP